MKNIKKDPLKKALSSTNSFVDETTFTDFLSKHWPKLLGTLVILVAALFLSQTYMSKKSLTDKKDFISAQHTYETYEIGQIPSEGDVDIILGLLEKHPELSPKYDGLLAQIYLNQENVGQALIFARRNLSRIEKTQPSPYLQFSEASLLIAQNQLSAALDASKQLNNYFSEGTTISIYPSLRLSNLLRMATLSQHLGHSSEELTAWLQFKELTNNKELRTDVVFENMNAVFQEGKITLMDFMEQRVYELTR